MAKRLVVVEKMWAIVTTKGRREFAQLSPYYSRTIAAQDLESLKLDGVAAKIVRVEVRELPAKKRRFVQH